MARGAQKKKKKKKTTSPTRRKFRALASTGAHTKRTLKTSAQLSSFESFSAPSQFRTLRRGLTFFFFLFLKTAGAAADRLKLPRRTSSSSHEDTHTKIQKERRRIGAPRQRVCFNRSAPSKSRHVYTVVDSSGHVRTSTPHRPFNLASVKERLSE